jgi:hypothetical protein
VLSAEQLDQLDGDEVERYLNTLTAEQFKLMRERMELHRFNLRVQLLLAEEAERQAGDYDGPASRTDGVERLPAIRADGIPHQAESVRPAALTSRLRRGPSIVRPQGHGSEAEPASRGRQGGRLFGAEKMGRIESYIVATRARSASSVVVSVVSRHGKCPRNTFIQADVTHPAQTRDTFAATLKAGVRARQRPRGDRFTRGTAGRRPPGGSQPGPPGGSRPPLDHS